MYRMSDLVDLTGLSRRTIIYYRTRRILPPPVLAAQNTEWTQVHLNILKDLVKKREARNFLEDQTVAVQTAYPSLFPPHERHRDLLLDPDS